MSLDVFLEDSTARNEPERRAIFIREGGQNKEITREEWDRRHPDREPAMAKIGGETRTLYSRNITHNLNTMAGAAGLYEVLWRPEEAGITHARQLVAPLAAGIVRLWTDPEKFKAHNPENGWGTYEDLVAFVADYLKACIDHPDAKVSVSR